MSGGARRTSEQVRAAHAHGAVARAGQRERFDPKQYKSVVQKTPALILGNGLGQALAFLQSKRDAERQVFDQLAEWLRPVIAGGVGSQAAPPGALQGGQTSGDFLVALAHADLTIYRRAQREALAYLQWMKRFAESRWSDNGSGTAGGGAARPTAAQPGAPA